MNTFLELKSSARNIRCLRKIPLFPKTPNGVTAQNLVHGGGEYQSSHDRVPGPRCAT